MRKLQHLLGGLKLARLKKFTALLPKTRTKWGEALAYASAHRDKVEKLLPPDFFLLPRKTVEKLSGLSRATIYRLIKAGKFPRPLPIGTGSVRWRQSEVIAWQQSLRPSV